MDYGVINKAVFYAVSIFITILIITYVLNYFSLAKSLPNNLNINDALYNRYGKIIEATMIKEELYGYEIKNLLNYFYDEEDINININGIEFVNNNLELYNQYSFNIMAMDKYKLEFKNNDNVIEYIITDLN